MYFSLIDSPVSEATIVGLTLLLGSTSEWTAFPVGCRRRKPRYINLNIHCSFFKREHISGAGMMAWRPDGSVVLAACNSIQNSHEVEEVEAAMVGNALRSKNLNKTKWCGIDEETKTSLLCLEEC